MNNLFSKEFAALYTALAWILFWAGLLYFARELLSTVFEAIVVRIKAGSPITIGSVGLGVPPK